MENMTNGDCLQMYNGLSVVKQPAFADIKNMEEKGNYMFHAKFIQAVSYNKRKLTSIVESFQDVEKPSPDYEDYLNKRNNILAEYAKKDSDGNPIEKIIKIEGIIVQKSYSVPALFDKKSEVSKKIKKLEEESKELIDQRKKLQKQMETILKEPCKIEFEPKCVPWSMIPKGLDLPMMDGVMFMIENEEIGKIEKAEIKNEEKEKVKH